MRVKITRASIDIDKPLFYTISTWEHKEVMFGFLQENMWWEYEVEDKKEFESWLLLYKIAWDKRFDSRNFTII